MLRPLTTIKDKTKKTAQRAARWLFSDRFSHMNAQTVLALNAQHVAGATLFANRADALAALPRGGKIAEMDVGYGVFSQILLERLAPKQFDAYDIFRLYETKILWGKPSADVFKGNHIGRIMRTDSTKKLLLAD